MMNLHEAIEAVRELKSNRGDVMEPLSAEDYKTLEVMDIVSHGDLANILNRNGAANWTVCPSCHVDDFCHVESCILRDKHVEVLTNIERKQEDRDNAKELLFALEGLLSEIFESRRVFYNPVNDATGNNKIADAIEVATTAISKVKRLGENG